MAARDLEAYRRDWHRRLHADDGSGVTCVALEGDRVLGIASASLLPQDATGSRGPIAAIRSVHVHPLRIGVGIGRELWHCVATFLRGQGVVRARVDTIAANARARRFFEAAGCRLVRIAPCGVEGVPVAMYALVLDPPDGALSCRGRCRSRASGISGAAAGRRPAGAASRAGWSP